MVNVKQCTKCKECKPLDDFYNKSKSKDGKSHWCKICDSEDNKKWHEKNVDRSRQNKRVWAKKNPDKVKESSKKSHEKEQKFKPDQARARRNRWKRENPEKHELSHLKNRLKKEYGLTLEEYYAMRDKQNGCCALCGKNEAEIDRRLDVDHDHVTGKVRGLLCGRCNKALGLFDDKANVLLKASSYVGV